MADQEARKKESLYDLLADELPDGVAFTFHHYSTPPTRSPALFSAPPYKKSERTYCESHFLAASIIPKDADRSSAVPPEELLVLAIEVLVYSTKSLTTIFVSKADSTGYISLLDLPRGKSGSPLKTICGTFVAWLTRARQRDGRKVVVSLFARAQDQYLFPASIENGDKHVLDDRGLVKWWCKVLDPIVREYEVQEEPKTLNERLAGTQEESKKEDSDSKCTAKGYLVIPGFEHYDILRFIPPSPMPSEPRRWATTHPLLEIAPHPAAPPRCLIPHFPDDPKARFLDELDDELPDRGTDQMTVDGGTPSRSNGQWKSVKSLEQFWEFMAFRQECSSGRIVGFIWVVITPSQPCIPEEEEEEPSQASNFSMDDPKPAATSTPSSQKRTSRSKSKSKKADRRRRAVPDYGPIPLILPRIKTSSSNLSDMLNSPGSFLSKNIPEITPHYIWPADSRGAVIFSAKDYNRAHEVLLQQNFATRAAAARSTKRWKEEVSILGGVDNWSHTLTGKKIVPIAGTTTTTDASPTVLMGVRKKRKPEQSPGAQSSSADGATVLGEGLVRKKIKVESSSTEPTASNGVNTLSAGLVRKKPKA